MKPFAFSLIPLLMLEAFASDFSQAAPASNPYTVITQPLGDFPFYIANYNNERVFSASFLGQDVIYYQSATTTTPSRGTISSPGVVQNLGFLDPATMSTNGYIVTQGAVNRFNAATVGGLMPPYSLIGNTGNYNYRIAFNGTTGFISNLSPGFIQVFDAALGSSVSGSFSVGNFPNALAVYGTTLFASESEVPSVAVFDTASPYTRLGTVTNFSYPIQNMAMSNGTTMYVTVGDGNSGNISYFDASSPSSSQTILGSFSFASNAKPYGLAFDGTTGFVSSPSENVVYYFDASLPQSGQTPTILGSISVQADPRNMVMVPPSGNNGTICYVACASGQATCLIFKSQIDTGTATANTTTPWNQAFGGTAPKATDDAVLTVTGGAAATVNLGGGAAAARVAIAGQVNLTSGALETPNFTVAGEGSDATLASTAPLTPPGNLSVTVATGAQANVHTVQAPGLDVTLGGGGAIGVTNLDAKTVAVAGPVFKVNANGNVDAKTLSIGTPSALVVQTDAQVTAAVSTQGTNNTNNGIINAQSGSSIKDTIISGIGTLKASGNLTLNGLNGLLQTFIDTSSPFAPATMNIINSKLKKIDFSNPTNAQGKIEKVVTDFLDTAVKFNLIKKPASQSTYSSTVDDVALDVGVVTFLEESETTWEVDGGSIPQARANTATVDPGAKMIVKIVAPPGESVTAPLLTSTQFTSLFDPQNISIVGDTNNYATVIKNAQGYFLQILIPTKVFDPNIPGNAGENAIVLNTLDPNYPYPLNKIVAAMRNENESAQKKYLAVTITQNKILQYTLEKLNYLIHRNLEDALYSDAKGFKPFIMAGYDHLNQRPENGYNGYKVNNYYQLVGFTYDFNNLKTLYGLGASESYVHLRPAPSKSKYPTVYGYLGLSSNYRRLKFGADAIFGYSFISAQRRVVLGDFYNAKATTNHGAWNVSIDGKLDYKTSLKQVDLYFYDTTGFLYGQENPYHEKGAPGVNQKVKDENNFLFRNSLGFRLDPQKFASFRPYVDASWVLECYLNDQSYKAAYENTSVYGNYKQIIPPKNFGRVQAGFHGEKGHIRWDLSYIGLFGEGFSENSANFNFDYKF